MKMNMSKAKYLINKTTMLVCLLIATSVVISKQAIAQKKPNIVFILTDDQSPFPYEKNRVAEARPFGFNGDPKVHTPIIDGLAKEGMIFENAYVSTSVCSASRYSILTGRYASRCESNRFMKLHPEGKPTRVENNTELEKDRMNIARYLNQVGYKTGFVGKCHVIDHDVLINKKKWEANGLKTYPKDADPRDPKISAAMASNHEFWSKKVKEYGFDYANGIYAGNLKELYNTDLDVHNVEWKNEKALEFIEQSGDEPFFLYYSETVPHGPAPWIKKNKKYIHGLDADPKLTSKGYLDKEFKNMPSRKEILDEILAMKDKDPGAAWLRWFDYAVGAVVDKLKETGKLENTLIVITSDHGAYFNGKTTLYQSGVRVPMMMYWPSVIKAGSKNDELVQNVDFVPTFLDLAGVTYNKEEMDGLSIKPYIYGEKKSLRDNLYFEIGFSRAVVTKDWKYIAVRYDEQTTAKIERGGKFKGFKGVTIDKPYLVRNAHLGSHAVMYHPFYFDKNQLFDLRKDPFEKNNIFSKESKKGEEMKSILSKYLAGFENRPFGEFNVQ